MTTLLIATRNRRKFEEIGSVLGARFRFLSLQDFQEAPPVAEDEPTFARNAVKKARELAKWLQHLGGFDYRVPGTNALVLADDSGLEVDALGGAPGIHSARFAALDQGPAGASPANAADAANNAKLLQLLKNVPAEKRTARFRCVIASVRIKPPQPTLAGQTFDGVCEGHIQLTPRGQGGFGYDPLFVPLGHTQSFGELGFQTKNKLSHRAQALDKLRRYLDTLGL
jgi:XTP/dITP diphosphohydrolase